MLFPVRWTALRRCVWTVSAPSRLAAALRFSTVGSLGSQGLTQLGELAWVSCTHGGRRYGQGGGHGDRPWLRPHQWEHPCHQSRDHRVVQVGALRLLMPLCLRQGLGSSARFGCVLPEHKNFTFNILQLRWKEKRLRDLPAYHEFIWFNNSGTKRKLYKRWNDITTKTSVKSRIILGYFFTIQALWRLSAWIVHFKTYNI